MLLSLVCRQAGAFSSQAVNLNELGRILWAEFRKAPVSAGVKRLPATKSNLHSSIKDNGYNGKSMENIGLLHLPPDIPPEVWPGAEVASSSQVIASGCGPPV
ncbi:hypothetical protein Y1Q_0002583 [Alligator mississippiensis]|uniref:Uncharacterized protein n=1 Tax=Alligator mississippiensis TaxID=8496 RepID=A0A151N3G7_ALLMI|nr:hypothetical protein Y1Q_0002583 [Alligator mississippiensis]